jgi:hypothetical protein
MAKRAQVQPDWLDDLLLKWGRNLDSRSSFPTICPMFRERVGQVARSYEPTGYCEADYRQLEKAIERLEKRHLYVLKMYYKPWTLKEMRGCLVVEYGLVTERTWRNWLHEAAACLVADMERQKQAA